MRSRYKGLTLAVFISVLLLPISGCWSPFFSAKGTVASSGGVLGQWSATPLGCSRDEFDGDSSKLVTFQFAAPKNTDPDRKLHPNRAPNGPIELKIAKNGSGYMAQLQTMKPIDTGNPADAFKYTDGIVLDSSSCKILTFDRTEHMKKMGDLHKRLSGKLVMDCTVLKSHVTADVKFKSCGT